MPSLSDRLKSLGVKVGPQDLPPPTLSQRYPIETVLPGRLLDTSAGQAYLVEQVFAADYQHGYETLLCEAPLDTLSRWIGEERIPSLDRSEFAFIDTETSGLAGGTGTFAFLIGAGRFEGQTFHLTQFFMRDPTEEPALLSAFEAFLAPCKALVTFNGKAFDAPLVNTRFGMAGWRSPLSDLAHVDLLHLSRRLWRDRLPSRTLGNLEVQILRTTRTEDEVPGWMIPQLYFDYLRTGDARSMKSVFYHNAMDVVSLAALFKRISLILADPQHPVLESSDRAALGRLFEELGETDQAIQLYEISLNSGLPEDLFWDTLQRLALVHKRRGAYEQALPLWEKAAKNRQVFACIELAKAYEHIFQDFPQALEWTRQGLDIVNAQDYPRHEQAVWLPELEHRLERLLRKVGAG